MKSPTWMAACGLLAWDAAAGPTAAGPTAAASAVAAAPGGSAPATEAAAAAPQLSVEQYTLNNGLTVILSQDHRLPVVAVEVLYRVGSGHERSGRTGFAHLFEHLMFQGSGHYDHEYFQPFEPIGGKVNGTTNRDRTNFFETVPANYVELPLWMESDRMEHLLPALTQAKLDNQREVVKNERRQSYENRPYGMALMTLAQALYPDGHPYQHEPIGSHEDLTAATLGDVQDFFRQYYVPANAVLAVAGDFETDALKGQIQHYFGAIAGGVASPPPSAAKARLTAPVRLKLEDDVKLPRVYVAWNTPELFAADDAELDLLSSVLTDGKSSRLYKPLVFDKKLAQDVSAFQMSQKLSGMYLIQATAAPGVSTDRLYDELMSALTQALATPPTAEELGRAVSAYKKEFYQRVEGVQSRVSLLASYAHFTGRADYLSQDLSRYLVATPNGIQQAAQRYLTKDSLVRLDVLPAPAPAAVAPAASKPKAPTAAAPSPTASSSAASSSAAPSETAPATNRGVTK